MDIRDKNLRGIFVLLVLIILCLSVASNILFAQNKFNNAVADITSITHVDEILIRGYENESANSKRVFEKKNITKLFEKLSGITNAKASDLRGLLKNSDQINNGSSTKLTITINGKPWYAMYLSSNRNGDPILTLWLADASLSSQWSYFGDNADGDYPANMYGTSMIRAVGLNNGGKYATNFDSLSNETSQNSSNVFAIYTMEDISGSLTSFIDTPSNVAWQETVSARDNNFSASGTNYSYNFNNDAYSTTMVNFYDSAHDYQSKTGYTNWSSDKIWLPSMAETGWSQKNGGNYRGLWKTDVSQRLSGGSSTFLRSVSIQNYNEICLLNYEGNDVDGSIANTVHTIRPAFHLNLAKVEEAAANSLTLPQDVELEYNGNEQGVESKYSQDFLDSVDIAYYDEGSSTPRTKPTAVGNYTVKYTLKDGYYWSDNLGGAERIKKFTITQRKLDFPKFDNSQYSIQKQYAGDEDISFTLGNYDKNFIEVTYSGTDSGVSYDATYSEALAKYVGKYYLDVKIKDEYGSNCVFKDKPTNNKLEFEVIKKEVETEILDGSSSNIVGIRGSKKKVTLNIPDAQKKVHSGKKIYVQIIAKDEYNEFELSGNIEITGDKLQYNEIELNIGRLRKGSYDLDAKVVDGLNGASYSVSVINGATLEVKEVEPGSQLIWQMYSGSETDGSFVGANIGDIESEYDSFAYDGKEYHFEVTPPTGYTVESKKTTNSAGDEVEYGKNADTYITTVELKETANNEITEYRITWTIEKAKYDLSGVRWEYDGKIPFSTNVSEMKAKIDEKTLPEGLSVERYTGVREGAHAGDSGNVSVTFILESGYEHNYELPQVGGKGNNYTYNGSEDFSWEMNWTIEKLVIKVEWESENYEGKYDRQKLKEDKNVVEYEYYLWDNAKKEIVGEALSESEIEIVENEVRYYVTKAVIKSMYANDVEFDKENVLSSPFSVGENATGIGVTLSKTELTYNGKSQAVKLKIEGALSESDFEIEYYDKDGTTALAEAPTKVGKYRVEIRIKEGVEGYYLSGENVLDGVAIIEYEIKQMEIKNDVWNTKHNPPSLSVSASEIKGIKHEYRDIDGNVLEFKDLKPGNKYEVRAVITDKTNYIFADESTETEWVEFEVKENEEIFDPDDPNNPYYPSEDNNNSTNDPKEPTQTVDFDKVLDILKEWWQAIASGISIVLILMFTAKGIGYASKKKENKRIVESKYKTYYVTGGTGLFGLSMTNWTIIAGVLMGVAVLSLVFMLIEKKGYKKSVKELEDAKEEYARNREEMMFMRMNGGNNGGQGQGFAYAQPSLGAEEIRGIVSETMTAMLPGMQQMLPQQASTNDELINKLIEQNAHNEERIRELTEHSDKRIEKLMKQLSEQKPVEKVIEREVAAINVSEEILERLVSKLQPTQTNISENVLEQLASKLQTNNTSDETIKRMLKTQEDLMRNQDRLMEKILELSANKSVETQVVEKIVEKPIEKIVEIPVEKIVEKEVVKEVPVEVEKIVEIPAEKPAPKAKVTAPRLTLDEAYAKLSAKQKKFFDTLKEYAMSKDKCKEKKSTYYILLGQSSVNPLVKLTIKKDCTVALFKMEDEYMKDIRRNAGSEGTKVKVKETELIVGDSQALATAKEMIDLREDQIERYNDFLKEQRSLRKK